MEENKDEKPMVRVEDFEEYDVKCADCEELLLKMVKVRDSEKSYRMIIECPFCDGESWLIELVGDYFQQTPKRLKLGKGGAEDRDGVLVTKMKRRW
jgi:hypothetical protein